MSLIVEGLAKHYGEAAVFEHVSLEVATASSSPSSANRASASRRCSTAWRPRQLGRRPDRARRHRPRHARRRARALWRRRHVGFVFQAFHVLPHLDVAQNVALPLMLLGRHDPARVQHMLDAVGLAGLGPRLPQQLSGGQLQRVAIARALVHRPALLLADEPTGNLDPTTAARVMDVLVAQTRAHGASLVLVTHSEAAAGAGRPRAAPARRRHRRLSEPRTEDCAATAGAVDCRRSPRVIE